jgi:NAD(P)-dependent dehydrogenase (short-subunit alcohol dehydrogenase family)
MRISIIGQIGSTLARRFAALGHQVFIANSRVLPAWQIWRARLVRKPFQSAKRPVAETWSLFGRMPLLSVVRKSLCDALLRWAVGQGDYSLSFG